MMAVSQECVLFSVVYYEAAVYNNKVIGVKAYVVNVHYNRERNNINYLACLDLINWHQVLLLHPRQHRRELFRPSPRVHSGHHLYLGCTSARPLNAMVSSEDHTSTESERSRLPHRKVTGGLLRPVEGGGRSNPPVSSSIFSVGRVFCFS